MKMGEVEDILLTGGTGSLGKTVVATLAGNGHRLHLAARKEIDSSDKNITFYQTDLTNSSQAATFVQAAIEKNKHINAGVFLAGGFEPGDLSTTWIEDIEKMISLNFATAFNVAQNLIQHFRTTGGGKLIFIGAKSAMEFDVAGNNLAYSLSKQLLFNFSELINQTEKHYGISTHILLPGAIDYSSTHGIVSASDYFDLKNPEVISQIINNIIEGSEKRAVIGLSAREYHGLLFDNGPVYSPTLQNPSVL